MTTSTTTTTPSQPTTTSTTSISTHHQTSQYETYAPRCPKQRSRLAKIESLTDPLKPRTSASSSASAAAHNNTMMTLFTSNTNENEDYIIEEYIGLNKINVEDINSYAHEIRNQLIASSMLYEKLDQCINVSEGIMARQDNLIRHSIEVSANCERLTEEVQVLTREADEIGAPLKHFDAVDRVGVKVGILFRPMKENANKIVTVRGLAKIKVDDEDEYVLILNEIDEACVYFDEFNNGNGAVHAHQKEYGRRAQILQEAATFLLKEAVVDRIKQTTADVRAALNLDKKGKALSADKLEASLVYTRYHGISSRSRTLIAILQDRVSDNDKIHFEAYRELLLLCQTTYCSCRESLLRSTVEAHIESLRIEHGIVGMTRLASAFLERLCNNELSLYRDFFGKFTSTDEPVASKIKRQSSARSSLVMSENELQKMMNALCSVLHRCVRKGLVQLSDLDTLCQVVSVLREERSIISSSKSSTIATSRTMSGVIEDAQERLIYISQRMLQKEVMKFKPCQDDLDYPAKFLGLSEKKANVNPIEAQLLIYETWYPPLKSVLRVLSKLFQVVDQQVFEDIALLSVQGCTKCLKDAANKISTKTSESFDSDLFLVKHMLVLREQLSPFDVELKTIQRQLDFSEAGKAVANFLAKRNRHLLTMSNENALVMLMREGVSVQESSIDSKHDLDDALRNACNDFIQNSTVYIVKELNHFVESCKTISVTDAEAILGQKFMNGDQVKKVIKETKSMINDKTKVLSEQMVIYLDNAATQDILMKPIIRKVSRVLIDAKRYTSMARPGTNGWNIDIVNEVDVNLKDMQELLTQYNLETPEGSPSA